MELLYESGKVAFLQIGLVCVLFGLGIPAAIISATKLVDSGLSPKDKFIWGLVCLFLVTLLVGLLCSLVTFTVSGPPLQNF
jgi:hypothetical protein